MANMKEDKSERINHPNQVFSQVFLPFLLFSVMVVFAGYFLFSSLVSGNTEFRMWSDISLIVIFLPLVLLALPLLMVILAHILLVARIQQKVLAFGKKVNPVFNQITKAVANLANLSTKPLIALKSGFSFLIGQKQG